jgi:GDP-L-fucose synthase
MARQRILILGASGFIGRNMAEAFADDDRFEVVATTFTRPPFEHPGIEFVTADLRDPQQVDAVMRGTDIVIQAAATTSGAKDIVTRPYIHVTDNAVMNSLLFRSAFEHKVGRFVFFSCTTMYQPSDVPQKEDDFVESEPFVDKYFGSGWTKVYLEKMCEFFGGISDTRFTVIRHSNIYGPHDKYDLERSHVFGATVTKVMNSTNGKIVVWGRGEESRDLLYVSDLVEFVRRAIDGNDAPCRIYNVGSGRAVRIKDLVHSIVAASGRDLAIEHDLSQPTIPTSLSLDTTRARDELGWNPRVSLEDGIAMTLDWYRETFSDELPD